MSFQRIARLCALATFGWAGLAAAALPSAPGLDLGAYTLDRTGAIASTAMPQGGAWFLPPGAQPEVASEEAAAPSVRSLLAELALSFTGIRYRMGGNSPASGFDCSGFVRYVFRHGVGAELPRTSARQYHEGSSVGRAEMRTGDLVFFRTRGKHVSHVGIYLDHGRFIHAPSKGKHIQVSNLSEGYWARRYVGARRLDVLS